MTYHGNISFYLLQFKQIKKKEVFFMLQKKTKRVLSLATALALVCTGISLPDSNVAKAAKKAKLKTKKISLKVGKKKKIAISGKVKKAKYTFKSSKKAVASVSKSGVVTAKKKGNAVITVKEKKKKKKEGPSWFEKTFNKISNEIFSDDDMK